MVITCGKSGPLYMPGICGICIELVKKMPLSMGMWLNVILDTNLDARNVALRCWTVHVVVFSCSGFAHMTWCIL